VFRPASRTMPDESRSMHLEKIITGSSETHGAPSTRCWSAPAPDHSGSNRPPAWVTRPRPAVRMTTIHRFGRARPRLGPSPSSPTQDREIPLWAPDTRASGLLADVGLRRRREQRGRHRNRRKCASRFGLVGPAGRVGTIELPDRPEGTLAIDGPTRPKSRAPADPGPRHLLP
jgi:hypothetical protein